MDHTALLYFVGPAGAGKSTLVATLQEWMQHYRYDGVAINLDPGAETVAYEAAIDVREKFTLTEIMEEYSLGPNGAQVVCADLLAVELDWIKEQIDEVNCDYFLIDTPGQTELFLYREASKVFVENLSERAAMVLLLDPLLSRTAEGFVTQLLLASAAHLRFPIPMFPVLTKCDLLKPEEIDQIKEWAADLDQLAMAMPNLSGMSGVLSSELLRVLQVLALESNLLAVSSKEGEGMDDLYSIVQSTFAGGDDLEAHSDSNYFLVVIINSSIFMRLHMAQPIPLIVDRKGSVLTLSLNNPEKRNALNTEMMGALIAAIKEAKNYTDMRIRVCNTYILETRAR